MLSTSRKKIIVLWLVLSLLAGCKQELIDTSLLTGDPCAPPCWYNIVPGATNEEEVQAQLERNPFVKRDSLTRTLTEQREVPLVAFYWHDNKGNVNRIYLRDRKVLRIEIRLAYDLRLGEVVEKYGPPESVYAVIGATEFYWCTIWYDYPAIGLTLESYSLIDPKEIADGTISVSENTSIISAYYYAPTSLREMLGEVFLLSPEWVEIHMANRQKWEGFGRIKIASW